MATINLGRIKPVFRGAYNGATAYVVDDIVTSSDETFICILASTGNATSNATYWTKLAAKGTDGTDVGTTITTQGDILYRDGSGLQRLAKPASNKLLQNTSGGVLSWETAAAGGAYTLINSASFSTSSSIEILNTGANAFGSYRIHCLELKARNDTGSGSCNLFCRFSKDTVPNWESGSDYAWHSVGGASNAGSTAAASGSSSATGFGITRDSISFSSWGNAKIHFYNLLTTGNSYDHSTAQWSEHGINHDATDRFHQNHGAGAFIDGAAINGVQIYCSPNSITGEYAWYGVSTS